MKRASILAGIIAMLSFFSQIVLGQSFRDYHDLAENQAASENYEIHKLINGRINALFYIPTARMILADAAGYWWKIDEHGEVVDTLDIPGGVNGEKFASGMFFGGDYYIDWVFTGDKTRKKFSAAIDGNPLSEQELTRILDDADLVEFDKITRDRKALGVCYVRKKDRMVIMDINNHYDRIDCRCDTQGSLTGDFDKLGWQKTCLKGYKKRQDYTLPFLSRLSIRDWEDPGAPAFMQKFAGQFYHFEDGVPGQLFRFTLGPILKAKGLPGALPTSYWCGRGFFQLHHQSEQLHFKAFVCNDDKPVDFENFSLYPPPTDFSPDTAIVELAYRRNNQMPDEQKFNKYYEQDVGLYAVRKKIRWIPEARKTAGDPRIVFGQPSTYYSRNPWQPVFTGMSPSRSTWGDIHFFGAADRPHHYLLDKAAVPTGLHALPRTLTFSWDSRAARPAFKLYLDEQRVAWYHLPDDSDGVFVEMAFDEAEIVGAFQRFDGDHRDVQLEVRLTEIPKVGAALTVWLRNDKDGIQLKRTTYRPMETRYGADDKTLAMAFDASRLWLEYHRALGEVRYVSDYIALARDIATNSPYVKEQDALLNQLSAGLILEYTGNDRKDGYGEAAGKMFYHYVGDIFPRIGKDETRADMAQNYASITSNSLGYALRTNNDDMSAVLFEKLLGPHFDVVAVKNGTLLYNIACYYARHKDRASLMLATREARLRGKPAEQFMVDADFRDYVNDADFLRVLKASTGPSSDAPKTATD